MHDTGKNSGFIRADHQKVGKQGSADEFVHRVSVSHHRDDPQARGCERHPLRRVQEDPIIDREEMCRHVGWRPAEIDDRGEFEVNRNAVRSLDHPVECRMARGAAIECHDNFLRHGSRSLKIRSGRRDSIPSQSESQASVPFDRAKGPGGRSSRARYSDLVGARRIQQDLRPYAPGCRDGILDRALGFLSWRVRSLTARSI